MLENVQELIASLPPWLRWLGVAAAGATPFIESYIAAAAGVIVGVNPVLAILAAAVGIIAIVVLLTVGTEAIRQRLVPKSFSSSARRKRLRQAFDKYGVAGVSLIGSFNVPSHIVSVTLVSFGASKGIVILWQAIAISLWAVIAGGFTWFGVDLISTS